MKTNTFNESLMHHHNNLSSITLHNIPVTLLNTIEQQVLLIQARQSQSTGYRQSYELILRELLEHVQLKLTGKN
jgi:hypothetical protein